jgi:hypothetical protein
MLLCAERKMYPRKPAARRSDCIGKLGCHLQTGRGAAFKLVLLIGSDRRDQSASVASAKTIVGQIIIDANHNPATYGAMSFTFATASLLAPRWR